MSSIVIIGGGASGITAAIHAAKAGAKVTVLERENKPLKKLAATGNGKCNLTNLSAGGDAFLSSSPKKAGRIFKKFGLTETFAFFENLGILFVEKDDKRIYPACESAPQVVKLLLFEAESQGVKIKTNEKVTDIEKTENGFLVRTQSWEYPADKVIVSCGTNASVSASDPVFAETAAGKFHLRHSRYLPALTRLYGSGEYQKQWAGVRTFAVIRMYVNGENVSETFGELQLTETGISGIPVFDLSRNVNILLARGEEVTVHIDFFPDSEEPYVAEMIRKIQEKAPYKSIRTALLGVLPEKLVRAIVEIGMTPDEAAHILKDFIFPVTGPSRIEEAQVCSGGIDLTELTDNLECKKVPGLYITGEALDADGCCGGFNLQWAWTTGALAGTAAAGES